MKTEQKETRERKNFGDLKPGEVFYYQNTTDTLFMKIDTTFSATGLTEIAIVLENGKLAKFEKGALVVPVDGVFKY